MRRARWARGIALGYAAALCTIWVAVSRWAAITPAPASSATYPAPAAPRLLDEESAARVFAALRAILDGAEPPAIAAPPWRGQTALWCKGKEMLASRVESDGHALHAPGFGAPLRPPDAGEREACRLRLDVERGRGPIVSSIEPLLALSVIAGADGVGVDFGDRSAVLGPDELIGADLLSGHRPLRAVDVEMGLDGQGAINHLARAVGTDAQRWRRTPHRLFRVRYESWVEPSDRHAARAVPLFRDHPPPLPLTRDALRGAALAGASYLERHLRPDGRFDYQYDLLADQVIPDADDYSMPRHAGAAWYLAQSSAALAEPRLATAAARALRYLADHSPAGCDRPEWACVGNAGDRTVDLGSTAMALLAAAEYRRATGDARFDPWARRLAAFVEMMQQPDGRFRHLYNLAIDRADDHARLLYYSGEAAFALSRIAQDAGTRAADRARLADRVGRALDWLTDDNYAFFAGGFFFGEDHWTCIAADDAWDLLGSGPRRERHADFCEGFASFLARSRFAHGDDPTRDQPDLAGAYGFTPLAAPHPTPVGSRSEALIATYRIALRRGHAEVAARIADGVRDSLRFLLARQVRADSAWMMPDPSAAAGAFTMSDVKRIVRIDFVQHACSAMLRASATPSLSGTP